MVTSEEREAHDGRIGDQRRPVTGTECWALITELEFPGSDESSFTDRGVRKSLVGDQLDNDVAEGSALAGSEFGREAMEEDIRDRFISKDRNVRRKSD